MAMARKVRLEFEGACYHVINRGNYRRDLFAGKGAAESFEKCVFETAEKFRWVLHAYVIMRNHFHLAVETPEPNLSLGMKYLQGTWANRFNRFRKQCGRPFQGRYKALHVEPGHSLAQVAHYIHLNPVRAKVVPAERLEEFRWSSLWWFPQKCRPAWLQAGTVLPEAGGLADTVAGWRLYREYLAVLAEEEPRERSRKAGRLSRGWVIGTESFRGELLKEIRQQGVDLKSTVMLGEAAGGRAALREAVWEETLQAAATAAQMDLHNLGTRKSAPEKVLLAAVMKAATAVSNGWLNERLGMGTPASVSQFVRRFRLTGGEESEAYQRGMSRIKT